MLRRFNFYYLIFAAAVDLLAVMGGLVFAYQLRAAGADLYYWPFTTYLRFVVYSMPLWLVLFASQGLYNLRSLPRGWDALGRALVGLLSGWGAMIVILYLWRSPQAQVFPRLVIAYGLLWTALFLTAGRVALTALLRVFYASGTGVYNAVLLTRNGHELVDSLRASTAGGLRLVGIVRADHLAQLEKLSQSTEIDEVIAADADLDEKTLLKIIVWCENHRANFDLVPSLLSVRSTNVEVGSVGGLPMMHFLRSPLESWGRVYKRMSDLLVVIPVMIVLMPFYLLIAILIRLTSHGGAIYRQTRIGQDGQKIYIHKFRSMYTESERAVEKDWSSDESCDSRITPLGRFLRRTNLDELPQLWDIFVGKMSLVGPRPEQPKYVEKFSNEVPQYLRRHFVKSGLTGWAQINGLRGDTSIAERIKYDLYYIENWSIWFDIRIIIATILMIFRQIVGIGNEHR